jgi:acetyl-CoA synthetase
VSDSPLSVYPVKPQIQATAHIRSMAEYERLYRLSLDNPEWFWGEQAKTLSWFHPWTQVFDADYDAVDFAWYSGGRLNACYNCVDRHLPRAAIRPRSSGPRTSPVCTNTSPTAS